MKLIIDPMPVLRQAKADEITMRFNKLAAGNAHTDAAYAHKRLVAAAVAAGSAPTAELQAEACMRKMTALELARLILAKPNVVAQRELQRQELLARVTVALTPGELETIDLVSIS